MYFAIRVQVCAQLDIVSLIGVATWVSANPLLDMLTFLTMVPFGLARSAPI